MELAVVVVIAPVSLALEDRREVEEVGHGRGGSVLDERLHEHTVQLYMQ